MERASRHGPGLADTEAESQELADCRRFFAEIGGRATTKCLLSWSKTHQPESIAMKKLLGTVALMTAAGTDPETTWFRVSHYVNYPSPSTEGQGADGLEGAKTPTASTLKRGRDEQEAPVAEVEGMGENVEDGEPFAPSGSTSGFPKTARPPEPVAEPAPKTARPAEPVAEAIRPGLVTESSRMAQVPMYQPGSSGAQSRKWSASFAAVGPSTAASDEGGGRCHLLYTILCACDCVLVSLFIVERM